MATLKQLEANRRNAAKSTGPRTESGKAASRMNALKTGIDAQSHVLPGESSEALAALSGEYYERYRPSHPEQRALVNILISNEWLLRRLRRVEHQIWDAEFQIIESRDYTGKERPFGETFKRRDETFCRLQRRIDSIWRQYNQALRTLRLLQTEPRVTAEPLPAEPLSAESFAPEIGFVPSIPQPDCPPPSECTLHGMPRYRTTV
jgi:hypothetical protein